MQDRARRPGPADRALSLLCDPQTSGGLLVACADDAVATVIELFQRFGFERATAIGSMIASTNGSSVTVDL